MNNALEELIIQLQSAEDSAQSALAVADFACANSPDLARALAIASVPRWFTLDLLRLMLDIDLQSRADELHTALLRLPMVEAYSERFAHAVHDQTRLAIRGRLLDNSPEYFREVSARAAAFFGAPKADQRDFNLSVEHLYHLLATQDLTAARHCYQIAAEWKSLGLVEPLQALARSLEELCAMRPTPPMLNTAHGWALMTIVRAREAYETKTWQLDMLRRAQEKFKLGLASDAVDDGSDEGWIASVAETKFLDRRCGGATLDSSEFDVQGGLTSSGGSAEQQPATSRRDLAVSLARLADLALSEGDASNALKLFSESKRISEELAAINPLNSVLQKDCEESKGLVSQLWSRLLLTD